MVDTDAQRCVMLATDVKELGETFLQAQEFGSIFLVRVFEMLELTGWIDIVSRIDAHLLNDGGVEVGHSGIEVDIGHKGTIVA